MAENIPAHGTLESVPRGLLTKLGELNDNLFEKDVSILAYLFNEKTEAIKKSSHLVFVLDHQRRINCHLLEKYLRLIGLAKLSNGIKEELTKSGNEDFRQQDLEDSLIIEKNLDRTEGTLSKRSLKFRLLLIEVLVLSNFSEEVRDNIRMFYDLPKVIDAKCTCLLDVLLYDEKQRSGPSETIEILKVALLFDCQEKYVKKLDSFVLQNPHLFS